MTHSNPEQNRIIDPAVAQENEYLAIGTPNEKGELDGFYTTWAGADRESICAREDVNVNGRTAAEERDFLEALERNLSKYWDGKYSGRAIGD